LNKHRETEPVAAAAYIITTVSYDRKIFTALATDICKKKMI